MARPAGQARIDQLVAAAEAAATLSPYFEERERATEKDLRERAKNPFSDERNLLAEFSRLSAYRAWSAEAKFTAGLSYQKAARTAQAHGLPSEGLLTQLAQAHFSRTATEFQAMKMLPRAAHVRTIGADPQAPGRGGVSETVAEAVAEAEAYDADASELRMQAGLVMQEANTVIHDVATRTWLKEPETRAIVGAAQGMTGIVAGLRTNAAEAYETAAKLADGPDAEAYRHAAVAAYQDADAIYRRVGFANNRAKSGLERLK